MRSLQQCTLAFILVLTCLKSATNALDLQTDKLNCGRVNHACHENDGVASCEGGVCKLECNEGFVLKGGICAAASRKKGKQRKPLSLCPAGETACPIPGAKSFEDFAHSPHQISDYLSAKGGYECLETDSSLESCGGCASLGQGQNCNDIPNAVGVGCANGQCIIFSCETGYFLSSDGSACKKKPSRHFALHTKVGHSRLS